MGNSSLPTHKGEFRPIKATLSLFLLLNRTHYLPTPAKASRVKKPRTVHSVQGGQKSLKSMFSCNPVCEASSQNYFRNFQSSSLLFMTRDMFCIHSCSMKCLNVDFELRKYINPVVVESYFKSTSTFKS